MKATGSACPLRDETLTQHPFRLHAGKQGHVPGTREQRISASKLRAHKARISAHRDFHNRGWQRLSLLVHGELKRIIRENPEAIGFVSFGGLRPAP